MKQMRKKNYQLKEFTQVIYSNWLLFYESNKTE